MFLHLVAIGWLYVALMMSVAEAGNPQGTVLGAVITFILYGLLPVALVLYLLATPTRKRLRREREAAERAEAVRQASAGPAMPEAPGTGHSDGVEAGIGSGLAPDTGRHAPAGAQPDAVATVREEAR